MLDLVRSESQIAETQEIGMQQRRDCHVFTGVCPPTRLTYAYMHGPTGTAKTNLTLFHLSHALKLLRK